MLVKNGMKKTVEKGECSDFNIPYGHEFERDILKVLQDESNT